MLNIILLFCCEYKPGMGKISPMNENVKYSQQQCSNVHDMARYQCLPYHTVHVLIMLINWQL
jgi:hypothetical protein